MLATLKEAHNMHKRLYVYVTECSANNSGSLMKKNLEDLGIPCQIVLDASVGYVLEKVDLVLLGAEGVVESGGICNKVRLYNQKYFLSPPFFYGPKTFFFSDRNLYNCIVC